MDKQLDPTYNTKNHTEYLIIITIQWKLLSHVQLFKTPWTVAYQAPPSMGFSKKEYWSGLPFPSPGDLPDPGIEARSPALQADVSPSEPPGKPDNHDGKGYLKKEYIYAPWYWGRLRARGQGSGRGWYSWIASPTQGTWVEWTPGDSKGQGSLGSCSPWGCRVGHILATEQQYMYNWITLP